MEVDEVGSDEDQGGISNMNSALSSDAESQNSFCASKLKCGCIHSETGSSSSSDSDPNATHPLSASWNPSLSLSATCCLKQRTNALLNSKSFCDVTFIVGKREPKERISAHKAFLSFGSSVFKAMFGDNWSSQSSEIEVPDVEPFAFSNLVRYLYTDECTLTLETVGATLYAAKKYCFLPLEKHCVRFMAGHLCTENAFAILIHAKLFDEQKLIKSCLKVIDEETVEAISSSGFSEIDSTLLRSILERDSLNISEIELFKAICRWCQEECDRKDLPVNEDNQRLVLKEVLPLMRFPLMTIEEVSSIVARVGVLTDKELSSVYRYLSSNPKPPIAFNCTPRFWTKFKVRRFQETSMPFDTCDSSEEGEAIEFQVDRKLQFLGIKMYGSIVEGAQYSVRLQLTRCSPNKVIREESSVYTINGTNTEFEVLLKSPVWLTPNTDYEIWASIQGPPTFFGKKGMKKVTVALSHVRNVTTTFANLRRGSKDFRTNVEQGQIPEIIFST